MRFVLLTIAIAVEITLLSLAQWQWQRMEQKQARANQPVITTTLTGIWDNPRSVVLDNQPKPGVPVNEIAPIGWRLLTPLNTPEGVVIIDRGWLPLPPDRTHVNLTPFTQTGSITVIGQQADFPQRKGWLGGPTTTTAPNILAFLDATAITPSPTAPTYLQATAIAPLQSQPLVTQPPTPPQGINHFAYALQWAAMALVFPFLCLAAYRRKTK